MSIRIGIGLHIGSTGANWSAFWASLISATVENANPDQIVLTFPLSASLTASDFTVTVDGSAMAISSASWAGTVLTLNLASEVNYNDPIIVTFVKTGETTVVTNNVLYRMYVSVIGDGSGIARLRFTRNAALTVTLDGNARFYTDAAATLGESATWVVNAGSYDTRWIKCTSGTSRMIFSDATQFTRWGYTATFGLTAASSPTPRFVAKVKYLNITSINITAAVSCSLQGKLPDVMDDIVMNDTLLDWDTLDVGENGNITTLSLVKFRTASKITSAQMLVFLTALTNRAGSLPATITINDYADYAAPPAYITDAVTLLKATKGITTVTLGA